MTNAKKILLWVLVVAGVGGAMYEVRQAHLLKRQTHALQQRQGLVSEQIRLLQQECDSAKTNLTTAQQENDQLQGRAADLNAAEILKLRGEAGRLRWEKQDRTKPRYEKRPSRETAATEARPSQRPEMNTETDPQIQVVKTKLDDAKRLGLAALVENDGVRAPRSRSQTNYLQTNLFERVFFGSLHSITNPHEIIVFREKEAWFHKGNLVKTYVFGDGHATIKERPSEGFEIWESQHMISVQPTP